MIGSLRGTIAEKHPPVLLIDVNGVGYEVLASMNTFYQLPDVGQEITLCTHLVVREDALILYGFHEEQERMLFRTLIKINGVGPKMALAILSSVDPDAFVVCVNQNDVASLVRIPGVGKKTAERLIIEMRDRLSDWQMRDMSLSKESAGIGIDSMTDATQDAISALIALGYKTQEASRIISKMASQGLSSEEMIRVALQTIS